jgi:hypothetical protein
VEKTGVIRIAGGRQRVVRTVLEGRRKLEREFPFRPGLLEKTSVGVQGHRRPNYRVESNLTGVYWLVDWSVFQINIPPLVHITSSQASAIIKAATYP